MPTLIALVATVTIPPLALAAICLYGKALDRVTDRRLARRAADPAPWRPAAARLSQPGWAIEQLTPAGWAVVARIGGTRQWA